MRAFAVICIIALCSGWTMPAANAAQLTHDDAVGITEACLAVRIGFEEKPEGCVGEVSRICGERQGEGGSTNAGIVICATLEAEAWRSILDADAARLRARESQSQNALLEQALAGGQQWARDRCAYEASYYEGGSLARVLGAQCVRDTTAMRALDLYRRLHLNE